MNFGEFRVCKFGSRIAYTAEYSIWLGRPLTHNPNIDLDIKVIFFSPNQARHSLIFHPKIKKKKTSTNEEHFVVWPLNGKTMSRENTRNNYYEMRKDGFVNGQFNDNTRMLYKVAIKSL